MGSIQSAVISEDSWKPLACEGGWGGQRARQDLERRLEGPRLRFDSYPEVGRCCFGALNGRREGRGYVESAASELWETQAPSGYLDL